MINPLTHRKILKKGLPARAGITSMSMPAREASSSNVAMTLLVQLEGSPPYEVEDNWMVSSKETLGGGMSLPVKVDADDHQKVAIDWDLHRQEQAAAEEQRREMLAQMPAVGSGAEAAAGLAGSQVINLEGADPQQQQAVLASLGVDPAQIAAIQAAAAQAQQAWAAPPGSVPAGGGAAEAEADAGRLELLEKLSDLHAKGVLTDEEFAQQKAKVLEDL